MRGLFVLGMLAVLAVLAGCDVLFQINKLGDSACTQHTPRQQVTALEGSTNTLTVPVAPTQVGTTLVLTAAISTSSHSIQAITDDGNNIWQQVVSVQVASPTAGLEIWYAPSTGSATSITATLTAARSMGVNISEWACTQAHPFDADGNTPGASSTSATSSSLSTSTPDLVIGAIAFADTSTVATFTGDAEFTELSQFATFSSVGGRAAYTWAAPKTFEATWDLAPTTTWLGGILALKAQ